MEIGERCTLLLFIATLSLFPNAASQGCHVQLLASPIVQNLTTQSLSNNVSSDTDCQWTISTSSSADVVVLRLVDISLDNSTNCVSDYVNIFDGPDTSFHSMLSLCGVVENAEFTSTDTSLTVLFHSDSVTNNTDFTFEYTSREKSELCGSGTLEAHGNATQLTSPGYPYNYPGSISCKWTITADSAQNVIVMKLVDFLLAPSFACIDVYVTFYDGDRTSSAIIDTLCGNCSNNQFISTGPSLTLLFHADVSRNLEGFVLEYTSQEKSALCPNSVLKATSEEQYIISPGYPYIYTSDLECQWTITADPVLAVIVLDFVDISLQGSISSCYHDYVIIYDGPSTNSTVIAALCGQTSNARFISTNSSVTITFTSDQSYNYRGFKMGYSFELQSDACSNGSLVATATGQYLTSPSYPYNYQDNMDCLWIITSDSPLNVVVLDVLYLYLEGASSTSCFLDYVTLYDGRSVFYPVITELCGEMSGSQFSSTGPSMTVVFQSDSSVHYRGFRFQYTSQDNSTVCSHSALTANSIVKYISSPGYPNEYSSDLDCQWTITASSSSQVIVVNFVDVMLEGTSPTCSYDYVTIHDGPYSYSHQMQLLCGSQIRTKLTSSGSSMTIVFHTDSSNNFRGFKLQYTSGEKSALCSNGTLTAHAFSDPLESPNYPAFYPSNTDCHWYLIASSLSNVVVLDLLHLDLDGYGSVCLNDYVKIYDGSSTSSSQIEVLCGTQSSGRYESTGAYMTVVFHSDAGINQHTGFHFIYWSRLKSDSGGLDAGDIAAIIICSIGVPCLVASAFLIYRRRLAQKRPGTRGPVQSGGPTPLSVGYVVNPPQAGQYPGMQNHQIATVGTPAYNTNYLPPSYYQAVTVGAVPVGAVPVGAAPVGAVPVGAVPVGAVPVGAVQVGAVPVGAVPVGDVPVGAVPVGDVSSGQTPILNVPK